MCLSKASLPVRRGEGRALSCSVPRRSRWREGYSRSRAAASRPSRRLASAAEATALPCWGQCSFPSNSLAFQPWSHVLGEKRGLSSYSVLLSPVCLVHGQCLLFLSHFASSKGPSRRLVVQSVCEMSLLWGWADLHLCDLGQVCLLNPQFLYR